MFKSGAAGRVAPGCVYAVIGSSTHTKPSHYVRLRLIPRHSSIHHAGMTRYFASRSEQVEYVRQLVRGTTSGSVVVTGQPGIGRTTFLKSALDYADSQRDEIVLLESARGSPFTTLRDSYLASIPNSVSVSDAAKIIARRASGRRLIIAADDGHLMDYSSLFVCRELVHRHHALFITTRPSPSSRLNTADPTTCLAHERDTQTITLLPLSVTEVAQVLSEATGELVPQSIAEAAHAATGGNPGLLKALASATEISGGKAPSPPGETGYPGLPQLVRAAREAWLGLAISRARVLCRLALQCGAREEVAPIWAMLLLLDGRADECLTFLQFPRPREREAAHLLMTRALALAFGFGQMSEANDLLLSAAGDHDKSTILHAFRAWMLAVGGCADNSRRAIADISRGDHSTALFVHAANAALAQSRGEHADSVFYLRRAIASAETASGGDFPWIRPYLQASLIGSLTLCDRAKEAVSTAQQFHAHEPSSGWKIAVSLNSLFSRSIPASRFPGEGASLAASGAPGYCSCGRSWSSPYGQQACARSHTRASDPEAAIAPHGHDPASLLQQS
jgi:hypothetical protein